jgi:hypothetical protein
MNFGDGKFFRWLIKDDNATWTELHAPSLEYVEGWCEEQGIFAEEIIPAPEVLGTQEHQMIDTAMACCHVALWGLNDLCAEYYEISMAMGALSVARKMECERWRDSDD